MDWTGKTDDIDPLQLVFRNCVLCFNNRRAANLLFQVRLGYNGVVACMKLVEHFNLLHPSNINLETRNYPNSRIYGCNNPATCQLWWKFDHLLRLCCTLDFVIQEGYLSHVIRTISRESHKDTCKYVFNSKGEYKYNASNLTMTPVFKWKLVRPEEGEAYYIPLERKVVPEKNDHLKNRQWALLSWDTMTSLKRVLQKSRPARRVTYIARDIFQRVSPVQHWIRSPSRLR